MSLAGSVPNAESSGAHARPHTRRVTVMYLAVALSRTVMRSSPATPPRPTIAMPARVAPASPVTDAVERVGEPAHAVAVARTASIARTVMRCTDAPGGYVDSRYEPGAEVPRLCDYSPRARVACSG